MVDHDLNGVALCDRIFFLVHQELPAHQRADAVSSLVFEANARVRDPVYGCVGAIFSLQNQVSQLQLQLAVAQAELQMMQNHQHQHPTHNYCRFMFEDLHQQEQDGDNSSPSCHFSNSNLAANMSHCFGIISSPSSVFQDPLKQESLWT